MKQHISILLCAFLLVVSCRKKEANNTTDENAVKTTETETRLEESNASGDIKDCDDFLDSYETWANNLITLTAKYKDNPVTLATSPEYIDTMMEGMNFSQQWATISMSCATNSSYEKRMKDIQDKLDKRLKKLGLK